MRDIRFRAWDSQNKLMVSDPSFNVDWGSFSINRAFSDPRNTGYDPEYYTYMQYTGLKDKNGVEIYEGDMFEAWERSRYAVEWVEHCAGFQLVWVSGDVGDSKVRHHFDMLMAEYQFNKVGNIYETPEFLK